MGNIELKTIDTEEAAKNFSRLLEENRTYFLNGPWGSGKTEFLNRVKEHSTKKLVTLELWRLHDSRTVITLVFINLWPILYWGSRVLIVAAVVVSVLATDVINIGLSQYFSASWLQIAGLVGLIVAVCQFFKAKSDMLYAWLLTNFSFKGKVLVIDDFDRLANEQQEEAYKLFNLLSGKLPIVFVGDYKNLYLQESTYLSKIIDRRVELPFVLHPSAIWEDYFKSLEEQLKVELSSYFKNLVVKEQRNLRDRMHFNDYVNQEFFERGKLDHVQTEQQLFVIYIYLFHPKHYRDLIDNKEIPNPVKIEPTKTSYQDFLSLESSISLENLLTFGLHWILFADRGSYPVCFMKNKTPYYLYETVSNATAEEIEKIFSNDDKLKEALLSQADTDFYQYISASYWNFSNDRKEGLLQLSLQHAKDNRKSDTISYILSVKGLEIQQTNSETLKIWSKILNKAGFDISEQLYFLEKYLYHGIQRLGEYFSELPITGETFENFKRKDFVLLVYLSSKNLKDWSKEVWEAIDSLNDSQFIIFWSFRGVLASKSEDGALESDGKADEYTVWENQYPNDSPPTNEEYKEVVNRRVIPRLKQLEEQGYTFDFR